MNHLKHNPESEALLWNMVLDDDKKAFEKIFTLFYPVLTLYAKKYIEDKYVCEDIVQDVFVLLWEDRERLLITTSLRNYLKVSVRNHCLNHLKKEGIFRKYQEKVSNETILSNENEEDLYTLTELYSLLDKALEKLPDSYRTVFELHRMDGKNYNEIAEKLNLSVRTVKRYQSRTIEILKKDLKDYFPLIITYILIS
jgi:RNA polymerase sigma-70 factor (ECF subfamily)